jgi:hypothetical protein
VLLLLRDDDDVAVDDIGCVCVNESSRAAVVTVTGDDDCFSFSL